MAISYEGIPLHDTLILGQIGLELLHSYRIDTSGERLDLIVGLEEEVSMQDLVHIVVTPAGGGSSIA